MGLAWQGTTADFVKDPSQEGTGRTRESQGRYTEMKRNLRGFAVAGSLFLTMFAAEAAFAQKQGGILKMDIVAPSLCIQACDADQGEAFICPELGHSVEKRPAFQIAAGRTYMLFGFGRHQNDDLDPSLQVADAGQFQKLRRIDRTGADDDLPVGAGFVLLAVYIVAHADAALALDQQAFGQRALSPIEPYECSCLSLQGSRSEKAVPARC
jgi:hypothetical protein